MTTWESFKKRFKEIAFVGDEVDTAAAAERIRGSIWFRGSNVWILAFSIVIASVGLNVNSTAVIIGAMLISPLMGPIVGLGLSMGTNDTDLLSDSVRNLVIMVVVSLFASTLYFLLSPLNLVNPTELEARTGPTIYDVLIAFFGGLAGILENSRKERGTALAGVAIATALMPPLCTAGYGLAHWNFHFFGGGMFLFLINAAFIALATYLVVILLHFKPVAVPNEAIDKRKKWMGGLVAVIFAVSIWGAFSLIRDTNFERNVQNLVTANRTLPNGFIYDYHILDGHKAEIFLSSDAEEDVMEILTEAPRFNLKPEQIIVRTHSAGGNDVTIDYQLLLDDISRKALEEITAKKREIELKDEEIRVLKDIIVRDSLANKDSVYVPVP